MHALQDKAFLNTKTSKHGLKDCLLYLQCYHHIYIFVSIHVFPYDEWEVLN